MLIKNKILENGIENGRETIYLYLEQFIDTKNNFNIFELFNFINQYAYLSWEKLNLDEDVDEQFALYLYSRYTMMLLCYFISIEKNKLLKNIIKKCNLLNNSIKWEILNTEYQEIGEQAKELVWGIIKIYKKHKKYKKPYFVYWNLLGKCFTESWIKNISLNDDEIEIINISFGGSIEKFCKPIKLLRAIHMDRKYYLINKTTQFKFPFIWCRCNDYSDLGYTVYYMHRIEFSENNIKAKFIFGSYEVPGFNHGRRHVVNFLKENNIWKITDISVCDY